MARSRYRTVKGQLLDFDKFVALHGEEISIGNMGVNAKGDQVNAHGDIIKTRNELMKEKYLDPKARYNPIRTRSSTSTQPQVTSQPVVSQPVVSQSTIPQSQPAAPAPEEFAKAGVVDIRHRVLGQKGFDLRGSLANAVSVDLTTPDLPKPTTLTTLRRI